MLLRRMKSTKFPQRTHLLVALLVVVLTLFPLTAHAATEGWGPKFMGSNSALPGFWIAGEIVTVDAEASRVTLLLPTDRHARGMMRHLQLQLELDIDDDSVLLDGELAALELDALAEGDEIVVVPSLVWGNLVARLLYAGEPETLAEASYRGRVASDEGDTITLRHGRRGEITVQVSDETIWYDNGQVERPAELPEEIILRVLGVSGEDEAGEEVVRAMLITPGQ
jgi:hypothetical protein